MPHGKKIIKKYPRGGVTWRFPTLVSLQGVSQRIFSLQEGILKNFFTGVSQNRPTLQGDINYLTLKLIQIKFTQHTKIDTKENLSLSVESLLRGSLFRVIHTP
jgi:hypothetical protein